MAKKRVNFEVKTTGTVNSVYIWVEETNVTVRNYKGYIFLQPRVKIYDLVYLARGRKNATVEITTTAAGKELSKQKDKIVTKGRVYGIDPFKLEGE